MNIFKLTRMKKNFTTRSLHVPFPKNDAYNALDMPIYDTVAYDFGSSEDIAANFRGELPAHVYSRTSNPTVEYFEMKMKALTGAHQVLAVPSGMAANIGQFFGDWEKRGQYYFGKAFVCPFARFVRRKLAKLWFGNALCGYHRCGGCGAAY